MDMNQYLDMFIEESTEHLQSMNESLLSLEKNPNDKDLLNEIFRVSHTIKGMSGTMGFNKMSELTHEMENLLHSIRNGETKVTPDIVDLLFICFDKLEEHVNFIRNEGLEGEVDSKEIIQKLKKIINEENFEENNENNNSNIDINIDTYQKSIIKKAIEKGYNTYKIKVELNENCMLKAARAFIIFKFLEEDSEVIKSIPSVEDIEDEKFDNSFIIVILTKKDKNEILEGISSISEVKDVLIEEFIIENDYKMINNEVATIKEVEDNKISEKKQKVNNINDNKKNNKIGKTVRVDIERLDNLMNLVSELIIIKTRMEDTSQEDNRQNLNEAIEYLERITTSLHDAVMKVRMVPIERVFNRFPRMVRDLSKDLGKNIKLVMSGEETEVDRTVIDEIGDPLIHLVRNSIDHGIEKTEERLSSGKSVEGILSLKAYPDGNNVVIEVEDDGAGINIQKVKEKAIKKGLISIEVLDKLSEKDIAEFLFKPGFSTKDEITDLSGRGVGLDVVKSKIESIGGTVEVDTKPGLGTKFTIRIPLTLAIIQALLVKLREEIYAIPLSSIKEITTIKSRDIRKIQNQEVTLFRNNTLPIIRLHNVLGIDSFEENEDLIIVIVRKGDKEVGLCIDDLIGQQEIVIKSLGKILSGTKHLIGATILGNGAISLILDVNSLF